MELVPATEDDVPLLTELWYSLAEEMEGYSPLNELVYEGPGEVSREPFVELLASGDTEFWLVEVDDRPIGYVTLRRGERPSRRYSQYLDIVDLFVREGHRNEGHGTAVVDEVRALARARDCEYLTVSCEWANEDARRFYRDAGFEPKQVTFAQRLE